MTSAMRVGLAAVALAVGLGRPAAAQPLDIPALAKLIETQPADMDRSAWKDKRRDAARRLVASKDKRALPILLRLAEAEAFDIIGDIAIEGLGNLGDVQAVPALQRIVNDSARDKGTRELARKALAKLGASAEVKPTKPTPPPPQPDVTPDVHPDSALAVSTGGGTPGDAAAAPDPGSGTLLGGGHASSDLPDLPRLADDTLAAYERITFAGGTANLGYDSGTKRTDFDADVAGAYAKRIERESMAWGWDASAHLVAGYINPDGRAETRGAQLDVATDGEARFYHGSVYGVGKAAGSLQFNYLASLGTDPTADVRQTRVEADLELALGAGYGRLLDVGAAIRVRRLQRTLDAARALGKPIDAATAKKLQLTWWALRGERTTYRALVMTVSILREAGIVLGEPDVGLAYELLNVLRDSQLYLRPSGLDLQLAFGEGYLVRPDQPAPLETGRIEQLLASAGYGSQLDDDKLEVSGTGYGRLKLFAAAMQPAPWAVGATGRVRRFTYGEHGDPIGALDVSVDVEVSNDDLMGSDVALRITGELGFTWWLNQASGFRLAGTLSEDGGVVVLGAALQATYGFLDGTFAHL